PQADPERTPPLPDAGWPEPNCAALRCQGERTRRAVLVRVESGHRDAPAASERRVAARLCVLSRAGAALTAPSGAVPRAGSARAAARSADPIWHAQDVTENRFD